MGNCSWRTHYGLIFLCTLDDDSPFHRYLVIVTAVIVTAVIAGDHNVDRALTGTFAVEVMS